MRFKRLVSLVAPTYSWLLSFVALSAAANALAYDGAALGVVIEKVRANPAVKPTVVFDIDDTLMDTRHRRLRIFGELGADPSVRAGHAAECDLLLANATLEAMKYEPADTVAGLGIADPEFARLAVEYWTARYFTNEYLASDRAFAGAARFLADVVAAGGTVVYLTGRDRPRMGLGTESSLAANGFPLDGKAAILMMKPDKAVKDLDFKKAAFDEIAAMGEVVAAFENEPRNMNAMADRFPAAQMVFVESLQSNNVDVPNAGIPRIRDFR